MATFQPKNSKLGHWLSWIWKGNNGHFWGLTECPQCWHLEKARFDIKLKLGTTQISIGKVSWFFNHYIWYANSDNSFFQDMLKICWEKSVLRTLLAASHRAGRTRFSPWRSSSWTFWSATILGNTCSTTLFLHYEMPGTCDEGDLSMMARSKIVGNFTTSFKFQIILYRQNRYVAINVISAK